MGKLLTARISIGYIMVGIGEVLADAGAWLAKARRVPLELRAK